MTNDLIKKLKLKSGQRAIFVNAPADYVGNESELPEGVEIGKSLEGTFDFIQLFVHSVAELNHWAPQIMDKLAEDGFLWITYPKKSSKIKTDITRDAGWEVVNQAGFEGVALVAIDETWSAMRFRPVDLANKPVRRQEPRKRAERPDPATRVIEVPEELAVAFGTSEAAQVFFESLSYTNKKEYVRWITEAKREETRKNRILKTIEKLEQGLKNPSAKEV
ncbi:YdeI/OmpD-associated family protein [Brevibacillus ginsengisoli]|uniref:YdeI/OmpD-associated family protein n=1 Tax=Brevibacillus ginsengisoli TaxID=363854 RepID=UPI003CF74DDD